jgi:penicillin amidase
MTRKVFLSLGLLMVVLVAVALSGVLWLRTSLPQVNGTVTVAGLESPVEVVRDAHAVPHIFAGSSEDAYFALGYVHAQDRLWQMEFMRRLGAGRLAEVLGESAVGTDRFFRTLGLSRLAEAIAETLSPDVRAAFGAYAAGVNAWLAMRSGALPPEFILLRFEPEPWRPADSLIWSRLMALRLGRNWQSELTRARIAEELEKKGLAPEMLNELWPADPPGAPITLGHATLNAGPMLHATRKELPAEFLSDGASNGWILHGRRTETGKPILANDPHLRFGAPVLWYLARIEAPGLTVTGATVPGMPLTVLGHNEQIAWGITNAGGDVADLFVETVDPQGPGRYLTPDGPRPFTTREEVIRVKGGEAITMTVRNTRHGPVISDVAENAAEVAGDMHVLALATPALRTDDRTIEALFAINRARGWEDFLAVTADFHTPHQNLFYAARDGDIGFVSAGRIPVRKAGDGRMPVPGADGVHDWEGFIPFEMLPRAHNPPSGRIVNANNNVVDDNYPFLIAHDWAESFRAERIVETLDAKKVHSLPDTEGLQNDILSTAARQLLPLMLQVTPGDDRGRRAVEMLSRWDFAMRRDRPEPLIYTAWRRQLARALAEDELGETFAEYWNLKDSRRALFIGAVLTRDQHWCDDVATPGKKETCEARLALALDWALDDIEADQGPGLDAWRWGAAHRATFNHQVLTRVRGVKWLTDLSIESDGGDHTVNRGETRGGTSDRPYTHFDGAGLRTIYDLADLDNSRFITATGQSGNFLSPHYRDLLEPWRDGQYIRVRGHRDEIAGRAIGILSLRPGSP